jgi:hypothetical protein
MDSWFRSFSFWACISRLVKSLLGGIPVVGNLLIKFLALPLLFLVNGIGNLLAFLAIKMGYKKEIIDTKLLTWTFAGGLLIGFIIGGLI